MEGTENTIERFVKVPARIGAGVRRHTAAFAKYDIKILNLKEFLGGRMVLTAEDQVPYNV